MQGEKTAAVPEWWGRKTSEQARAMGTSERGVTNSNPAAGAGRMRRARRGEDEGVEARGGRGVQSEGRASQT